MSLWTFVCSVHLCPSVRKRTFLRLAGEFYLSQSAQSSLSIFSHVSSPQKAFGIQRTQSVSAIVDTDKEAKSSLHPPHMGISVITPLPFGGGVGGGAAIFLAFVCSVHLCSLWEKEQLRDSLGSFFSHRTHRFNRTFLRTVSSPWGGGPSPNPSPAGRGVICEVTPIRLLTYFVKVFSLTERTEFTEPFGAQFRAHRRPPAYRGHRGLSTKIGCNVLWNRLT